MSANDLIPTRQSLLSRLKDWNDQESWKVFFDTYWKLIYHAAIRAGLADPEAQDVVQETVISVLKQMETFDYQAQSGSFKGWLLRLTTSRIHDHLRRREPEMELVRPANPTDTRTATAERVPDPATLDLAASWEEEWERNLMEAAVERVKRKVDPAQYQLFDLYVIQEWPVSRVVTALQVNPASVYLAKHRIAKMIQNELSLLRTRPL
jgi:RNA polymerase sigma-70 factor (ECF subfamily)